MPLARVHGSYKSVSRQIANASEGDSLQLRWRIQRLSPIAVIRQQIPHACVGRFRPIKSHRLVYSGFVAARGEDQEKNEADVGGDGHTG